MKLPISLREIEYIKDALRKALPDVKSSHRVEAMARGLGWRTHAAMRAALIGGFVEAKADEDTFVAYLRQHSFYAPRDCLTRALAKAGIRRAMDIEPWLTRVGYSTFREPNLHRMGPRSVTPEYRLLVAAERRAMFTKLRAAMLDDLAVDGFVSAVTYLSRFRRRETINSKRSSSRINQDAQKFTKERIENGMLIAAALALGFTAQPTYPGSVRAFFNISFNARNVVAPPARRGYRVLALDLDPEASLTAGAFRKHPSRL